MDMKFTEEQVQLRDAARKFLEKSCTADLIREVESGDRGYSPEMWQQMAEMGWLGMSLPEEYGGLEMRMIDMVILAKELGRCICPSPFLPTAVIAGEAIARAGTESQKRRYLFGIAGGETTVAFAFQERTRRFGPDAVKMTARRDGSSYVLDGVKMFVEFARAANVLLVVAQTEGGLTMFLVDAESDGVAYHHTPTMARDRQYEVAFDNVAVAEDCVLGRVGDAWSDLEGVVDKAALVFASYTVGVAERMHEFATEFAKDRVQFGRPIGQMQLIQNYLASLIIEIYGAETITLFAAFNMDKGRNVRDLVAKAKTFAGETVMRTTDIGSQIFGGMGYMEENDTTQYLRRGKQYQLMLGGTEYWEAIVAEELLGPR